MFTFINAISDYFLAPETFESFVAECGVETISGFSAGASAILDFAKKCRDKIYYEEVTMLCLSDSLPSIFS